MILCFPKNNKFLKRLLMVSLFVKDTVFIQGLSRRIIESKEGTLKKMENTKKKAVRSKTLVIEIHAI